MLMGKLGFIGSFKWSSITVFLARLSRCNYLNRFSQNAFPQTIQNISHTNLRDSCALLLHLLGTVHLGCLSKEGQGEGYLPDSRNLPSMVLKALRVPQHHSSNQGDTAGTLPERANKKHEA